MKLKIEDLTPETFAPFGEVITQPARTRDASGPGWTWWGQNHLLAGGDRNYAIGYLDLQPAELSFDWAERHMHSDELLVPMGEDCLVYVGPPDYPDRAGTSARPGPTSAFSVCARDRVSCSVKASGTARRWLSRSRLTLLSCCSRTRARWTGMLSGLKIRLYKSNAKGDQDACCRPS